MKFHLIFCTVFVFTTAMGSLAMCATVDLNDGLFLHYSFDDPANLYEDSSGNEYHGTAAGNTGYVTAEEGKVYGGLGLDVVDPLGTSSGYITVPKPDPAVVPTEAVSISAWVNLFRVFNSPTDKERNTIFSTMAAPNGEHTSKGTGGLTLDIRGRVTDVGAAEPVLSVGYRTVFRGADIPNERNQHPIIDFEYGTVAVLDEYEQPTGEVEYYTPIEDLVDQWVHMCSTYDKATATAALYINGEKIYDLPILEAIDIDTDWNTARVGYFAEGGREVRGYMDDLRVYTRALNADEVSVLAAMGPIPGDANLDRAVNVTDLGILATNYGNTTDMEWGDGDFNTDGAVNVSDLGLLATYYGTSSASAVPEPTGIILLLGLGACALIFRRK